jgi:hypothetical protein
LAHRRWILLSSWAVVLAAGLGAGAWVGAWRGEAERREGLRVAAQAADLLRRARSVGAEGGPRAGEALLAQAAGLLRASGGPGRDVPLASVLADLAAAQIGPTTDDPGRRASAARLLDEAWALQGLPPELRARIARDQGALRALEKDLAGAEGWYAEASRLLPADPRARARLELLRATAPHPPAPAP